MNDTHSDDSTLQMKTIGIIGAGTMGRCVSADMLFHGFNVILIDHKSQILNEAHTEINNILKFAPLLNARLKALASQNNRGALTTTTTLHDLSRVDFVIENITEDGKKKENLYQELKDVLPTEICIGANTSCIPISTLAQASERPDRVVGVHFMNPAYLVETVEVIRSPKTSTHCLSSLLTLLKLLGKEAIIVEDAPGFVSNRISHLFMNEAAQVLESGIATAQQIDSIFKKCFGHKMGPLETADLIGLDTVMHSLQVLHHHFKDNKFKPASILCNRVSEGKLGRKAGQGFHKYINK